MADVPSRLSAALADRYSIERELGEGGMATVYLAHDERHDREVALKVLKPELAAIMGGERFLSEIRTTASLQHPHILPLYDSGEADSFLYYVMPYVEGESLRERLAREKQLSVEETLRIAEAVGGALDFAHKKGVVHRDIKPANILMQEGQPLVADFGIALAVAQAGGGRLTETGLSLGTPHYMSPEQAAADRDPDARSDVYSLGCVVYEMLTGEPPHLGGSTQAVLARVLTETPRPVRDTRPAVPPHVDAALAKALEKLPADRFDTAADFLAALEGRVVVDTGPALAASAVKAAGEAPFATRRSWLWPAVAVGALLVGAAVGRLTRAPRPSSAPLEVDMYVQGDSTYSVTNHCCGPSEAISQDGRRLVFMGQVSEGWALFQRDLDDVEAHRIPGTEGATTPFLDPSGRWLGFLSKGHLMKVDLQGGPPETVADAGAEIWGATWGDDGFIYFTSMSDSAPGIFRVSAQGGTPELVSAPDTAVEKNRVSPAALPGGRGLLYVSFPKRGGDAKAWVMALDLKDGSTHRLTQGIQPYYADGQLVYAQADGSIMARPFDLKSLQVTGDAVRVATDVVTHNASDTEYAVSRTGTLVLRHGGQGEVQGYAFNLRFQSLSGAAGASPDSSRFDAQHARVEPRFSPDGRRLAFLQFRNVGSRVNLDLWVRDLNTGLDERLSSGDDDALLPIWSADGRDVRWVRRAPGSGSWSLMSRPADLSGPAVPFAPRLSAEVGRGASIVLGLPSRSGGPIPFVRRDTTGNTDLWIMNADGTDPRPFLTSPAHEGSPSVSPSGKWIAYTSDETGRQEVWVEPFPRGGPRFRISNDGGLYPVWLSDRKILFSHADAVILAELDVTAKAVRATGYRTVADGVAVNLARPFDVSPDGRVLVKVTSSNKARLLVETNRVEQIRRRTGGG